MTDLHEKLNFHKHCFSSVLAKVVQTLTLRSNIGIFMVNVKKALNPRQLFFHIYHNYLSCLIIIYISGSRNYTSSLKWLLLTCSLHGRVCEYCVRYSENHFHLSVLQFSHLITMDIIIHLLQFTTVLCRI